MKILEVLTYYRPWVSGLTIYVERLSRALVEQGHEVTVLELGPQLHYSHRFELENSSGAISPYGSLFLDINHVSFENDFPGEDDSDTDLDLVARFGMEWEATRKLHLIAEVEVGRGNNFTTGINVPF